MKAKAVNDVNRFVILELPAPATHEQRQQIAHRIATALEDDEPTQLERYKQALQRANGFLIMNNLEPVKLDYSAHEPPAVQSKIAARDVHYRLIEDFGLANDPSANDVVRRLLEGLTRTTEPPCAGAEVLARIAWSMFRQPGSLDDREAAVAKLIQGFIDAKSAPPPPAARFKVGDRVEWSNEYDVGSYHGSVLTVHTVPRYTIQCEETRGITLHNEDNLRPSLTKCEGQS